MIYISYFTDEKKKCPIFFNLSWAYCTENILFIVISQILSANCNIFFNGFVAVNNSVI